MIDCCLASLNLDLMELFWQDAVLIIHEHVMIGTSVNLLLLPHIKVLKNGFGVRDATHLLPSHPDHLGIKRVGFAYGFTRGSRLSRVLIVKLLLQLVVDLVVFWVLLGLSFDLALLNLLANLLVLVLELDHVEA